MTIFLLFLLGAIVCCRAQCPDETLQFNGTSNETITVYSPNWPSSYADNDYCTWVVEAPEPSARIEARITFSDISCCCDDDSLTFIDGGPEEETEIARLCAEENPLTLTSSGPQLFHRWKTGDDTKGQGFTVEYTFFDVNDACPPGWEEFEEHCYKLYLDQSLIWEDALDRCGYDGGFLASIHSEEENIFLNSSFRGLYSSLVWIGYEYNDNTLTWIDETTAEYTNYGTAKLDVGDCGAMDLGTNGTWINEECDNFLAPFICKKRKDGTGNRYRQDTDDSDDDGAGFNVGSTVGIVIACVVVCSVCQGNRHRRQNQHQCRPPPPQPPPPAANYGTGSAAVVDAESRNSDPREEPPSYDNLAMTDIDLNELPPPPSYDDVVVVGT